jgi:hypothetical protein
MNDKELTELEEYVRLEGTELGECILMMIAIKNYGDYPLIAGCTLPTSN